MTTTIDNDVRDPFYSPVCTTCRHLDVEGDQTCRAFPQGIPAVIWRGDNMHRRPYPGDHGIQYEPVQSTRVD